MQRCRKKSLYHLVGEGEKWCAETIALGSEWTAVLLPVLGKASTHLVSLKPPSAPKWDLEHRGHSGNHYYRIIPPKRLYPERTSSRHIHTLKADSMFILLPRSHHRHSAWSSDLFKLEEMKCTREYSQYLTVAVSPIFDILLFLWMKRVFSNARVLEGPPRKCDVRLF